MFRRAGRLHGPVARCQRADDLRDYGPVRLQRIRQVLLSSSDTQERLGLSDHGPFSLQVTAALFV